MTFAPRLARFFTFSGCRAISVTSDLRSRSMLTSLDPMWPVGAVITIFIEFFSLLVEDARDFSRVFRKAATYLWILRLMIWLNLLLIRRLHTIVCDWAKSGCLSSLMTQRS